MTRRELTAEMGHNSPALVFRRHQELVEPADAARYWNIRPAVGLANIVPMLARIT